MRQLTVYVVGDGGTDRMLIPIVEWAIGRLDPDVQILEPTFEKRRGTIADLLGSESLSRQHTALRGEGRPMLMFVHRDAENVSLRQRLNEFAGYERRGVVPVVPVRMSETWLLIDGRAIARAAGRSAKPVRVPRVRKLESVRDPKRVLDELLVKAAGQPTGRRLQTLKRALTEKRVQVASYISDFSRLEKLEAFREFQRALRREYPYRL